jgi:CRP-like cAMP-binding protein
MENYTEQLLKAIESGEIISETIAFPANTMLLQYGDIATDIYYIKSGILGVSTIDSETEKEKVAAFFEPNECVISYNGIVNHDTSILSIKTLTDCELILIDKEEGWRAAANNHALHILMLHIGPNSLYKLTRNYLDMLRYSPLQRYRYMIKNHQYVVKNVKSKYIASYLGITEEHFSTEIKRKT